MRQLLKKILPESLMGVLTKSRHFVNERNARIRRQARLKQYAGDNVECPFCKKTFSRFRPTGVLDRPFWKTAEAQRLLKLDYINVANALCPWCGSGERHRALYFYLRDRLKFGEQRGIALLDVAPDRFLSKEFFCRDDLQYVSIDIDVGRVPTVVMDVTALGFAGSSFDAIICYHVLEHILDDLAAISELYRVLKPGGWAIIQVPVWAEKTVQNPSAPREQYTLLYGHPGHVRRCGPDYVERLKNAGFKVHRDSYIATLPKEQIQRYGLFDTEEVWYCEKS